MELKNFVQADVTSDGTRYVTPGVQLSHERVMVEAELSEGGTASVEESIDGGEHWQSVSDSSFDCNTTGAQGFDSCVRGQFVRVVSTTPIVGVKLLA